MYMQLLRVNHVDATHQSAIQQMPRAHSPGHLQEIFEVMSPLVGPGLCMGPRHGLSCMLCPEIWSDGGWLASGPGRALRGLEGPAGFGRAGAACVAAGAWHQSMQAWGCE
jgi:hypothetical protein